MKAMLYGIKVQLKIDIRSKTLLVTCYVVPLLFFAIMGGIFTSLMPEAKNTLIQSMTVMGGSMGAFIGVPPSMVEVYGTDIKKMYIANGIPLCFGVITLVVSAFIHLMIMSMIIFTLAPIVFHSTIPSNIPLYFITLALFVIVSLAISCGEKTGTGKNCTGSKSPQSRICRVFSETGSAQESVCNKGKMAGNPGDSG